MAATVGASMLLSAGMVTAAAGPAAAAVPGQDLLSTGTNNNDELGTGTKLPRTTLGDVQKTWSDSTTFVDVAVGDSHTLAVTHDGLVYAWGSGWLGDGTSAASGVAKQVPNLPTTIVEVAAGVDFSLARTSAGEVYGWGHNDDGEVGVGDTSPRYSPTPVTKAWPASTTVVSIAAGRSHSLAATSDGNVWAWGYNSDGQLGLGQTDFDRHTVPEQTESNWNTSIKIVEVAAGYNYSLARSPDGYVFSWGYNGMGQLGSGSYDTRPFPYSVGLPGDAAPIVGIASSPWSQTSLAVDSNGQAYAWGSNSYGQIGNPTYPTSALDGVRNAVPVDMSNLPSGTKFTAVAGGNGHSLAVAADGTAYAWGRGDPGQLGNDGTAQQTAPVPMSNTGPGTGNTPITAIGGGWGFSVAIGAPAVAQQQGVLDWGWNCDGQLGNHVHGESHNSNSPVQPSDPTLPATADVSAGYYHTLAVTSGDNGGHVYAWGNNNYGQVGQQPSTVHTGNNVCVGGTPSADDYVDHPTQVGTLSNIVQAAGGQFHSLALAHDGTIWAWGSNVRGQLGDPTFTGPSRAQPTQVQPTWPGTATPVAIAAGDFHSMALLDDGTVWAWGDNSNAELGNGHISGTSNPTPAPVQGLDGVDVKHIATGIGHGMAASDTALYTWGLNIYGQLGDGSTNGPVATAQQVTAWPADTTITALAAGSNHSLAIGNGDIYTWGAGANGRLCNSGLTNVLTPKKITAQKVPHPVKAIAGGGAHSLAIGNDNQPYACGANTKGQLGTGDNIQYTTPQPVDMTNYPGQSHTQLAAGADHSITR